MRCLYICEKTVTGEVDRDKMLTHLKEEAVAIPDMEERVEFVPGTIRGKQVTAHYILMYRVLFFIYRVQDIPKYFIRININ